MTAESIIEQIKALPREEREKVFDYVRRNPPEVRYISEEKARESIERVFTEHRELFRLLAQDDTKAV